MHPPPRSRGPFLTETFEVKSLEVITHTRTRLVSCCFSCFFFSFRRPVFGRRRSAATRSFASTDRVDPYESAQHPPMAGGPRKGAHFSFLRFLLQFATVNCSALEDTHRLWIPFLMSSECRSQFSWWCLLPLSHHLLLSFGGSRPLNPSLSLSYALPQNQNQKSKRRAAPIHETPFGLRSPAQKTNARQKALTLEKSMRVRARADEEAMTRMRKGN